MRLQKRKGTVDGYEWALPQPVEKIIAPTSFGV
ncbi:hypothetical protein TNCV_4218611, partial [Trichonephila clavipes]